MTAGSACSVVVYHAGYGCGTGCCGHRIKLTDDTGEHDDRFFFEHPPDADFRAWAEDLVRAELGADHVADLDWDNCIVVDD